MIDFRVYTLLQVHESKSFSKAAQKLGLTQPAVSQHIKALEEKYNATIFVRKNGDFIVTKEGKLIVQTARKMIGLDKLLVQEIQDKAGEIEHLSIGVTHTMESNPIAEALAKFCSENEGISIKILTNNIKKLYKMLRNYELDMIFIEGRSQEADMNYFMLDTDYLVLAAPPTHPFANREFVTLNELKKERLILRLPGSGTQNLFVAHLESNNMSISDFNVILELDNVATIKDLVRRDFGVSILPKSVCLAELKKGKIVTLPVENLSMIREMNIVYRKDSNYSDILGGIVKSYNETLKHYI